MSILLLLASCVPADDESPVDYRITLLDASQPRLAIEVEVPAAEGKPTEFSFGEEWGGVRDAGVDFELSSATDENGGALDVKAVSTGQWSVAGGEARRVHARFEIGPTAHRGDWQGSEYYQPIVEPRLVHLLGGTSLPWPKHLEGQLTRTLTLTWKGFDPSTWSLACSHGIGPGPFVVKSTADAFRHAVFVAGDFTVFERTALGSPVRVAVWGDDWGSSASDFADQCSRIVEIERAFFEDRDRPPYLITLIPVGKADGRSHSLGGTGLVNSFALFMQPGAKLNQGPAGGMSVTWLLAHEMFHEWNGMTLRLAQPERRGYWFSEGFTDFYARRLLARNGLLDDDAFIASWNRRLAEYATHPERSATAARIEEAFWSNRDVQSLPYVRGDVIALKVDYAIRKASQGQHSLDDLMRDLVRRSRQEEHEFSVDDLLAEIEHWSDAATAAEIRATALDGAHLELPVDVFGQNYRLPPATIPCFDLGFDFERTRAAKVITGLVPDSAAARAGLREGDVVRGFSVAFGQVDTPVVVTVSDNSGSVREVKYLPQGHPCQGWRLERTPVAEPAK
jgi:predicted metalloprotease with PDZ domain